MEIIVQTHLWWDVTKVYKVVDTCEMSKIRKPM